MNRQPVVAGTFYPVNPKQLHQQVAGYLQEAKCDAKVPKAMIVPHAGYVYSGPVAASGYARLQNAKETIKRVVLVGPSHRVAFKGLAVSKADNFITPLGNIPLDKRAIGRLVELPFVNYFEKAHQFEHSLEVHLPFLQESLADFKLIPVVAGDATPEQVAQVLDLLWGGPETLIIISSDLSHYHDYETAKRIDELTSKYIENQRLELITFESACGKVPVNGLLKLAKDKSLTIKTIDLRNSGDTAGDKTRVVGYGTYVID